MKNHLVQDPNKMLLFLITEKYSRFASKFSDFVKPYFTYINKNQTKLRLQTEPIPCTNRFEREGQWLFYESNLQYKYKLIPEEGNVTAQNN